MSFCCVFFWKKQYYCTCTKHTFCRFRRFRVPVFMDRFTTLQNCLAVVSENKPCWYIRWCGAVALEVPFFIQKDLESWVKHSHGRCGSPVSQIESLTKPLGEDSCGETLTYVCFFPDINLLWLMIWDFFGKSMGQYRFLFAWWYHSTVPTNLWQVHPFCFSGAAQQHQHQGVHSWFAIWIFQVTWGHYFVFMFCCFR